MRKNTKKLVLPAIAAAGAVMGAVQMASADYVVTLSAAHTSASFDFYTLSVINNGGNSSGTLISGADVTISMNTAGQFLKVDTSQDLGTGSGYSFDGHPDVNLTGSQNAGTYKKFAPPPSSTSVIATKTVNQDSFSSNVGTFVETGQAGLTADFENGIKDSTKSWSTDANGGVLATAYSSLSSLEVVVANTGGGVSDASKSQFVNVVVPHGDKFTVTGSVGGPAVGGGTFQTNFSTTNGTSGGGNVLPVVVLSATSPSGVGSQLVGTYTPSTSPTLTVVNNGAPGEYFPGFIHSLTGTPNAGLTAITGFTGGDVEKFLLKLSSSADDTALVADINANNANTTLTASLASTDSSLANLGGTAWDIELTEKSGAPANGFFGFNLAGDTNAPGITVTDVAAVPEPATVGLLLVGGLGLLARRRRSAN
jgi:hypothetical protein